jgi:hypothetical protein
MKGAEAAKRSGEREGGGDFCAAGADFVDEAFAFGAVADLIVVLRVAEEARGGLVDDGPAVNAVAMG